MLATKVYGSFFCLGLLFTKTLSKVGQKCDPDSVVNDESCLNTTELCDVVTHTCQCHPNYNINDTCVLPESTTPKYSSLVDNQGNGSLIAGILIPLILITIVICSIYISKRFELGKWLRDKWNQRNRNYDEFMIGQDDDDDPPLV